MTIIVLVVAAVMFFVLASIHGFYKKKVYKKRRLKWPKSEENRTKITRQTPKFSVFIDQKSIFHRYGVRSVNDGIQIQVYNSSNENVNHLGQFISARVKKNLGKFQAQFREKSRKLRIRQMTVFFKKGV